MGRALFVRDVPDDVHAWLEARAAADCTSKRAALVAVVREAAARQVASERSEG